jgi:hypothetical protein
MVKIKSKADDERKPLKRYEDYYEITRQGEIYSIRLGRFIKRSIALSGAYILQVPNQWREI